MSDSNSTYSASPSEVLPLLEFSKVVNSSLDLQFILSTLLLTLMGKLLLTKGIIVLTTAKNKFKIEIVKGIAKELQGEEFELPTESNEKVVLHLLIEKLKNYGITKIIPIVSHGQHVGYFGIGERNPLSHDQLQFVNTLINISAAAIEKGLIIAELKIANRNLDGKIHQLKTLFELAKEFGGVLNEERLFKLFSLTLMGQIGTNRYAMCLKEGKNIVSKISEKHLEEHKNILFELIHEPVLLTEELLNGDFCHIKSCMIQEKIRALIPLQVQNEVKGILCLGERMRGSNYTQTEIEFVYSLSNLAFVSLENARLFKDAVEKKKLENELLLAKEIQQGLLPKVLPLIQGFELAAINVSSKQVGGDYYDVIQLPNEEYVIAIGDVSGKGTPASLLMANVQATLRALVPFDLPLPEATARVNNIIYENTSAEKFITFFWGKLDAVEKEFTYVNAGHNPPFVMRADGSIERLTEGGIILGIMKTIMPYQQGTVKVHSGDSIIMFTDGVSEAMDMNGNDYTEERLETFIKSLHGKSAQLILTSITDEITTYAEHAPQSDDITLVVMKAK